MSDYCFTEKRNKRKDKKKERKKRLINKRVTNICYGKPAVAGIAETCKKKMV